MQFINTELCSKCGGKCCRNMGGIFIPEQFKDLSIDGLYQVVKDLKLSIDWYEGCPLDSDRARTLYLRMRNINSPVIDPAWGSTPCIQFTEGKGCALTYEERPYECQRLIPSYSNKNREYNCHFLAEEKINKAGLSIKWIPYQHILLQVEKYF